jgi:folate-dependent phosphoribosylglycinamide formyltransferase PurN
MLNIHPGLLPSFGGKGMYGQRVHAAVLSSGARFSGPTVHFVDEEFDTGPILAQRVVPVYPTDTAAQLAARVLKQVRGMHRIVSITVGFLFSSVTIITQALASQCRAMRWLHPLLSLPPLFPRMNMQTRLQEHQVYPEAVSALVDERITWRDDGVPILWTAH